MQKCSFFFQFLHHKNLPFHLHVCNIQKGKIGLNIVFMWTRQVSEDNA